VIAGVGITVIENRSAAGTTRSLTATGQRDRGRVGQHKGSLPVAVQSWSIVSSIGSAASCQSALPVSPYGS
jgi:hypothetical protein